MNRDIDVIPKTRDALRRHPWPGNVREFENVIQRAVILSTDARPTLPPMPLEPGPQSTLEEPEMLRGVERAYIARMLEEANRVIGGPRGAAARLGLKSTTLHSLLKRLALSRPRDAGGAELEAHGSRYTPERVQDETWAVG